MITIFTPTYNRGYIINNLFESLKRQTIKDFEWVVIDDGSTDETERIFEEYKLTDCGFDIIYEKVQNGGKHCAINKGVKKARGELFFIVDSDDYLTDDAVEKVIIIEKTIPEYERINFAGICGNRGYSHDSIIGTTFTSNGYLDITTLDRKENGITGDKAEVFYTDILRKYPFPSFPGEKFLTECVVWDRIAFDGYKLRFFNEILIICNYLPDGLTEKYNELLENNPKGWGLFLCQRVKFGKKTGLRKWDDYKYYYAIEKKRISFFQISKNLNINPIKFFFRLLGMKLYKCITKLYRKVYGN